MSVQSSYGERLFRKNHATSIAFPTRDCGRNYQSEVVLSLHYSQGSPPADVGSVRGLASEKKS
jgi:hypothetical protein